MQSSARVWLAAKLSAPIRHAVGDDRPIIGLRHGRKFRDLAKLRGVDTVQLAERIVGLISSEYPDVTVVDGDGLSAAS